MPDRAKRSSENDRAAVVSRFGEAFDQIEANWPGWEIRLPSPRADVVVVEMPLELLETILAALPHG